MRKCLSDASVAMDAHLNAVYGQLMVRLGKADADLLRASQRRWLAFRDAELAFADSACPPGVTQPCRSVSLGSPSQPLSGPLQER
jgi:uncharacterized protein YecT (DUF1311 family)